MKDRRRLVIGAQTAAVAVLVAIVYVVLLAPTDTGPLEGIDAPGGPKPAQDRSQRENGDGNGRAAASLDAKRRRDAAALRGDTGDARAPALAAGSLAGSGELPLSGDPDTTPNDDQYENAATQILRAVAGRVVTDG